MITGVLNVDRTFFDTSHPSTPVENKEGIILEQTVSSIGSSGMESFLFP